MSSLCGLFIPSKCKGFAHQWLTATAQSGYAGTAYLHALPDVDVLYQTSAITSSPAVSYLINFTMPGTYTVWLRGFASNAAKASIRLAIVWSKLARGKVFLAIPVSRPT